jgi:hypothetical protein
MVWTMKERAMRGLWLVCAGVLALGAGCKVEAKMEAKGESKAELKAETTSQLKVEVTASDAAPDAAAAPVVGLPARIKLFDSQFEASEALFKAAFVDKSHIARAMEAAPTAEELRAVCPGFVLEHQLDPSFVTRYMEAICPYDVTPDDSLTLQKCREQLKVGEEVINTEEVEAGDCGRLKVRSLSVGTLYCGVPGEDGDEGNQTGFLLEDAFVFELDGRWGVLFAREGVDDAYLAGELAARSEESFLCRLAY